MEKMTELSVEKLNIVDKSGTVKMTLFNQDDIPPAVFGGKKMDNHREGTGISGLMFYNGFGDEMGGLVFGTQEENGQLINGGSLTFDKYRQDQLVQLQLMQQGDQFKYGVEVFDRPDELYPDYQKQLQKVQNPEIPIEEREKLYKKIMAENPDRAFFGRDFEGNVGLHIKDSQGNTRIQLVVDKDDNTVVRVLNKEGKEVLSLNPEELN